MMRNPRGRPRKYTDRHRYMIEVLHLRGMSADRIARIMRMYGITLTRRAVESIIYRLPYRRSQLSLDVRQRLLDGLKVKRLDQSQGQRGLPDQFFRVNDE